MGGNSLDRRGGVSFHPGVVRRSGGFRAAVVEWGGKGVSTTLPSAPGSIRHQRGCRKDSVDRGDKITNDRG